jgi:hypothetical protein
VINGCEEIADVVSSLKNTALLVALAMMAACGSGTSKAHDAGKTGADSGADGSDTRADVAGEASNETDASLEANSSDASDAAETSDAGDASRTCLPDGGTSADPLVGTWVDTSGAEQWTVSNGGGCSVWIGRSAAGALCDSCFGSYTVTGSNQATLTLTCTMISSCSTSPDHVDVGTVTVSGCSLTYDYDFGTGSTSSTVTKLDDVPRDVCPTDASAGN